MTQKEIAYKKIAELIERFDEHIDEYKRGGYNETQTRNDYIDPFFEALGWDIYNKQGHAEAYRDVIHEDKIKVGGATKAPDYCFTLTGTKKFFVEAKKPSINIKGDITPAYQIRRYGWSAKLPIAIVTDFEEFSVYECNRKPNPNDKASTSRIKYLTYKDYLNEFDYLWETFSKERILKGSFDKYVQSDVKKRGTTTVDDEFLKEIDGWRKYLATTFALRNKQLSEDEINYAVQKTIDRIIFLRICEDRSIEIYGNLKNALKKGDYYKNLFEQFYTADEKYNSGLFDFKEDKLTPSLAVDNKVIKNIIQELYYPLSPYEFSVLPADILGHVYERFLGKTIRLTPSHYAKIEEKPEVRKAGGVYYTPKYIVDYIVENTVGKAAPLNPPKGGKLTPKDVEKIKIVDPACGSGSFLIDAYQYLLDWHLKYYTNNPPSPRRRGAGGEVITPDGNLTTAEKKRILLNNIYGVDIDPQAVEVTKLNLLLKAMEGETQASINKQLSLFHERVLPNLSNNIKCGNSLIGTDFYDTQLLIPLKKGGSERSEQGDVTEQIKKINAFDWEKGFPEIFEKGGFDVVIGNPPYLSTKRGFAEENPIKIYLKKNYKTAIGQFDAYTLFIEKSINILKRNGIWSFIIPKPILTNENMEIVRKMILENGNLKNIADFGVPFKDANVESTVLVLNKSSKQTFTIVQFYVKEKETKKKEIQQKIFLKTPFNSFLINMSDEIISILLKVENNSTRIRDLSLIFVRGIEGGKKDESIKYTFEKHYKKLLRGEDVNRYKIKFSNSFVDVNYLNTKKFKTKEIYEVDKKILIRRVGNTLQAFLDKEQYWNLNTIYNLHLKNNDYEYFLGIFNSKLINFWFKNKFAFEDKLFPYTRISQLNQIPIRNINFNNSKEKQTHDTIVQLVENLLNLNKELKKTKLETQRNQLQRAIEHAEDRIDELVYGLYGLSEEEIRIVEGGNK